MALVLNEVLRQPCFRHSFDGSAEFNSGQVVDMQYLCPCRRCIYRDEPLSETESESERGREVYQGKEMQGSPSPVQLDT